MRILHLCLACFYIDNYNYQENILPRLSSERGHSVKIIASTETYINNEKLGYVNPASYMTEYGVPIVRLPYKTVVNQRISAKLRIYDGLQEEIEKFHPDIIFSHDLSFGSLPVVVKYVKEHKNVCFLSDTHTADYNSGQNWVSLNVLHKLFYKSRIQKALPYVKKVYYIGPAERDFSLNVYGVPEELMEFLPLGGVVLSDSDREKKRNEYRHLFGIEDDELLFVHSGKLSAEKETAMLLSAFSKNKSLKAKLIIIGSISDSIRDEIMKLINADDRISYLGWKDADFLQGSLCACDLYCQPGTPSATLQNAICCGSAIMAKPYEGYRLLDQGNFLWIDSEDDIVSKFEKILNGNVSIETMRGHSLLIAKEYLDYAKMEEKIRGQA